MITKIYLKPSDIESNEVVYLGNISLDLYVGDRLVCKYHDMDVTMHIHNIIINLVENTRVIYCRLFKK